MCLEGLRPLLFLDFISLESCVKIVSAAGCFSLRCTHKKLLLLVASASAVSGCQRSITNSYLLYIPPASPRQKLFHMDSVAVSDSDEKCNVLCNLVSPEMTPQSFEIKEPVGECFEKIAIGISAFRIRKKRCKIVYMSEFSSQTVESIAMEEK